MMNETTIALAQLMGPVLFVLGLSGAMNHKMYMAWRKQLNGKNMNLVVMGVIELVAGLAIVLGHNYWDTFPQVLVSFLGWVIIFEALMLLLVTDGYAKMAQKMLYPSMIKVSALASIILGAYLSWFAYMM